LTSIAELPWIALIRTLLVYLHLLALLVAVAGMTVVDLGLFSGRLPRTDLHRGAGTVTRALAALWVTGLLLISLDTGWQLQRLMGLPKLQAKLIVVLVLSANGWLLHRHVFSRVDGEARIPLAAIRSACLLGAVSTCSWAYAMFLGIAGSLTPLLGLLGFLSLYGLALLAASLTAQHLVAPRLHAAHRPGLAPIEPPNRLHAL
jgi:hypothetical protein